MSELSQRLAATRKGDASPNFVLAIGCAAVVMAALDVFIVNVALPKIGAGVGSAPPGAPL